MLQLQDIIFSSQQINHKSTNMALAVFIVAIAPLQCRIAVPLQTILPTILQTIFQTTLLTRLCTVGPQEHWTIKQWFLPYHAELTDCSYSYSRYTVLGKETATAKDLLLKLTHMWSQKYEGKDWSYCLSFTKSLGHRKQHLCNKISHLWNKFNYSRWFT